MSQTLRQIRRHDSTSDVSAEIFDLGFPELLEAQRLEVARALPKHIPVERILRVALTAFRKTPALGKCQPISVLAAVLQASQLGLEINQNGEAFLVPFHDECQLIPGYKGLMKLVRNSGFVKDTSEVQKMILAGSVGASLAVEVIREHGDQAAEFLKGKLEIAKSHGKTKVKPSLVREWIPPRKSVEQIYSSLGSLVGGLKQRADIAELIQQVGERGAQTLDGQAVSVDASTLMQLMQAFDEAEQLKAKRLRNTVESKGETDPAKGAVEQTAGEVAGA